MDTNSEYGAFFGKFKFETMSEMKKEIGNWKISLNTRITTYCHLCGIELDAAQATIEDTMYSMPLCEACSNNEAERAEWGLTAVTVLPLSGREE
jgi:hypothetical protein